jgi:hypothetical protein
MCECVMQDLHSSASNQSLRALKLIEPGAIRNVIVCTYVCGPSHLCSSLLLAAQRVCDEMFAGVPVTVEPVAHTEHCWNSQQWVWGAAVFAYTDKGCILYGDTLTTLRGSRYVLASLEDPFFTVTRSQCFERSERGCARSAEVCGARWVCKRVL